MALPAWPGRRGQHDHGPRGEALAAAPGLPLRPASRQMRLTTPASGEVHRGGELLGLRTLRAQPAEVAGQRAQLRLREVRAWLARRRRHLLHRRGAFHWLPRRPSVSATQRQATT
ncbi:unnamed protein product, partial [Prorocentrum cordatum]